MPNTPDPQSIVYDSYLLLDQAALHRSIANFYDRALQGIREHGNNLANQMLNWIPDDATTYKTQWLHPTVEEMLTKQRDDNNHCAEQLEALASEVVLHERRLSHMQ